MKQPDTEMKNCEIVVQRGSSQVVKVAQVSAEDDGINFGPRGQRKRYDPSLTNNEKANTDKLMEMLDRAMEPKQTESSKPVEISANKQILPGKENIDPSPMSSQQSNASKVNVMPEK